MRSLRRCFAGVQLTQSYREGDHNYEINQRPVPLDSFEDLMESGELEDSRVIAALFMARKRHAKHYYGWECLSDDDWLGVLLYFFGSAMMLSASAEFVRRLRSDSVTG